MRVPSHVQLKWQTLEVQPLAVATLHAAMLPCPSELPPLSTRSLLLLAQYNSTWATTPQDGVDVEPIGLPVPREFSFIHVDGWGVRGFDSVEGIKVRQPPLFASRGRLPAPA
eukprot:353706-Chlamydomonas_euryale.AAC.11